MRGVAVFLCAALIASCRAILGTEGYRSSSTAICDLLDQCYATGDVIGCEERVGSRLNDATPDLRQQWLRGFSDANCLESCSSARRCLDLVPVCADKNRSEPCRDREDCCGFLSGRTDCNLIEGRCCSRRGVDCKNDIDCCPGAGACLSGVCGGRPCLAPGRPCHSGPECCSGVCTDFVCADAICFDNGFECASGDKCCSGFCDPATGRCAIPECGIEGTACSPDGALCCGALICATAMGDATPVCSPPDCFPAGLDCASDDQCCSGHCDFASFQCVECLENGSSCSKAGECCGGACSKTGSCITCSTSTCATDEECCSQNCIETKGICGPACQTACSHDECQTGGALGLECTSCANGDCLIDQTCVSKVCAADSYCCCGQWDALCVSAAVNLCTAVVCD